MSRLDNELRRVFGDPPELPRAVVRVQVGDGQGLAAGQAEADRFVNAGADLMVLDAAAPGPAALAAVAVYLGLEPVAVVGTTATAATADWKERVVAVRDLLRVARPYALDPPALVEALGDPLLGRVIGLLDRLSARRTPVVLGGSTTTVAAALVVQHLQPSAERWWIAGSAPVDGAGALALAAVGLSPLLDLDLQTGGADLAVALVRAGLEQLGA